MKKTIYHRNLRRFSIALIGYSILGMLLGGALIGFIASMRNSSISGIDLSILFAFIQDGISLLAAVVAWLVYRDDRHLHWALIAEIALAIACAISIINKWNGNSIDTLFNFPLILIIMIVYTMLQINRDRRQWNRIKKLPPVILDLKLLKASSWFNPMVIGPHLELDQEIASAVDHFLQSQDSPTPLEIHIHGQRHSTEIMQETMREIFVEHYQDEKQRVNSYLESRYVRAITLAIVSLAAVSIWVHSPVAADTSILWTIIGNFAGFSLWQIGNTYFERNQGYAELLRVIIAGQAVIKFI